MLFLMRVGFRIPKNIRSSPLRNSKPKKRRVNIHLIHNKHTQWRMLKIIKILHFQIIFLRIFRIRTVRWFPSLIPSIFKFLILPSSPCPAIIAREVVMVFFSAALTATSPAAFCCQFNPSLRPWNNTDTSLSVSLGPTSWATLLLIFFLQNCFYGSLDVSCN